MHLCLWIHAFVLPAIAGSAVVIEAPSDDAAFAATAIESCEYALGAGACKLADGDVATAAEIEAARWRVRVAFFDDDKLEAQVELREARSSDAPLRVRHVEFAREDDLRQRYRALGLVVASQVLAAEARRASEAAAQPASAPPPATEPAPSAPFRFGMDVGVLGGPGLDRGGPRVGLLLRGRLEPRDFPVAPLAAARVAHRFEQPGLLWLSAALGLSVSLTHAHHRFGLELRGELVAQHVTAEASSPQTDEREREGAFQWGGRLGADLLLKVGGGASLFAGADAQLLRPALRLAVGGAPAGADPALSWSALLGVRFFP